MGKSNLESMLDRLRAREITFDAFVGGTKAEFRGMALYLMRRWMTPEWMVLEDVEQELYIGAWKHVWKFDPARGKFFAKYVCWNAVTHAKRAMHKARGASIHGSADKNPSRYEVPVSRLAGADDTDDALIDRILSTPAAAEEELAARDQTKKAATEALWACATREERYAVLAIREAGSIDGAASLLYGDIDHRIDLRLGSEEQAEKFVKEHATDVARRVLECASL